MNIKRTLGSFLLLNLNYKAEIIIINSVQVYLTTATVIQSAYFYFVNRDSIIPTINFFLFYPLDFFPLMVYPQLLKEFFIHHITLVL
jgi:hypothetical protein